MNCTSKQLKLYGITDRSWLGTRTLAEDVKEALEGGVTMIQLREKELDYDLFLEEAMEIKSLCKAYQVPFIINDNIEIAIACDADGIHVGQSDTGIQEVRRRLGPEKIVGATAKTVEQAKKAETLGADYLGSGAVFGTTTKLDAKPMAMELFHEICNAVKIPVCAIGGITKKNIKQLEGSNLAGVALVSTIFAASDIKAECEELGQIVEAIL